MAAGFVTIGVDNSISSTTCMKGKDVISKAKLCLKTALVALLEAIAFEKHNQTVGYDT